MTDNLDEKLSQWREVYKSDEEIYSDLPDEDEVRELLVFFSDEMKRHIQSMERAIRTKDWRLLDLHVHQLKGAGSSFGYTMVTDLAGEVERLLRQEELQEAKIYQAADVLVNVCKCIRPQSRAEVRE